jgi:hypothetical protein
MGNKTLFSCLGYVSYTCRVIVNDELKRMRDEAAVIYFMVLSEYLPGETGKSQNPAGSGLRF